MVEILVLGAVKTVKIVAVTVATLLAGLATQVPPAADWVTETVTARNPAAPVRSADPRALFRVPAAHRSQRGAERATVFAISATSTDASVRALSVRCSTVSRDEWMRREADPST